MFFRRQIRDGNRERPIVVPDNRKLVCGRTRYRRVATCCRSIMPNNPVSFLWIVRSHPRAKSARFANAVFEAYREGLFHDPVWSIVGKKTAAFANVGFFGAPLTKAWRLSTRWKRDYFMIPFGVSWAKKPPRFANAGFCGYGRGIIS